MAKSLIVQQLVQEDDIKQNIIGPASWLFVGIPLGVFPSKMVSDLESVPMSDIHYHSTNWYKHENTLFNIQWKPY